MGWNVTTIGCGIQYARCDWTPKNRPEGLDQDVSVEHARTVGLGNRSSLRGHCEKTSAGNAGVPKVQDRTEPSEEALHVVVSQPSNHHSPTAFWSVAQTVEGRLFLVGSNQTEIFTIIYRIIRSHACI
jgi:hypothetical protein